MRRARRPERGSKIPCCASEPVCRQPRRCTPAPAPPLPGTHSQPPTPTRRSTASRQLDADLSAASRAGQQLSPELLAEYGELKASSAGLTARLEMDRAALSSRHDAEREALALARATLAGLETRLEQLGVWRRGGTGAGEAWNSSWGGGGFALELEPGGLEGKE